LKDQQAPSARSVKTTSLSAPAIEIIRAQIDLGAIPADQHQVIGEVRFRNLGGKPLQIHKVTATSPCFAGFSGDRFIPPGKTGLLKVKFDTAKIPAGDARQLVNIETNDPNRPKAAVHFRFRLERDNTQEQVRLIQNELSAMRNELQALRRDVAKALAAVQTAKPPAEAKPTRPLDATVYEVAVAESPTLGPQDAKVTIVEFVDFQCPYCIREWPKIKQILQQYPDTVKVVFKHFPLNFHKKAAPAHAAAELARLQGGQELFWKMHNMIIAQPKNLDVADLREHAKSLNMDLARLDEVVADQNKINELLSADLAEAKKCNVRGTPTVLINGSKLTNRSIAAYKARIEEILAANKG
jgi:protein-disulfide isomerase